MRLTYAVIPFAVLAATAIAEAAPDAQYCVALGSLNSNLDKLDGLGSNAAGRDVRGLSAQLGSDIRQIQQQAALSNSPAATQFLASSERLLVKSQFVPDSMPVAQATSQIRDDETQVRQSAQALASQAGCPGAPAAAQGQPQQPGAQQAQQAGAQPAQQPGAQQPPAAGAAPPPSDQNNAQQKLDQMGSNAQPLDQMGSNAQQKLDQMGSNVDQLGSDMKQKLDQLGSNMQQPLDQGSNLPQLPDQGSNVPAPTDLPRPSSSPE